MSHYRTIQAAFAVKIVPLFQRQVRYNGGINHENYNEFRGLSFRLSEDGQVMNGFRCLL